MAANADPTFEGLRFVAEGGHSEQCRGEKSCATVLWNSISAPTSLRQGQKALIVLRHDFEPRAHTTTGTHWPGHSGQHRAISVRQPYFDTRNCRAANSLVNNVSLLKY